MLKFQSHFRHTRRLKLALLIRKVCSTCLQTARTVDVAVQIMTVLFVFPSLSLLLHSPYPPQTSFSCHCYLWPVIAVDLKWYTTPSTEKGQPQKGYIFNPMSFPIQSIACPQKDLEWQTCRECSAGPESARYKQCKLTFILKNCFCFLAAYYQHIGVRQKEGLMVSLGNTRSQNHSREAGNRVFPGKWCFYHNWLLPHPIILLVELSTHHKSYDAVFAFLMEV